MEYAYINAGTLNKKTQALIREVAEHCGICRQNGRSRSKPRVAVPRAGDFNAMVTMDLKEVQ